MKVVIGNIIALLFLIGIHVYICFLFNSDKCIFSGENNVIAEGVVSSGKREGVWIFRYENGYPMTIGRYENNIMAGVWKEFYDDSLNQLRSITYYVDNMAEKERVVYDNDGKIIERQLCVNDKIKKKTVYQNDSIIGAYYPVNENATLYDLYEVDNLSLLMCSNRLFLNYVGLSILLCLLILNIMLLYYMRLRYP